MEFCPACMWKIVLHGVGGWLSRERHDFLVTVSCIALLFWSCSRTLYTSRRKKKKKIVVEKSMISFVYQAYEALSMGFFRVIFYIMF